MGKAERRAAKRQRRAAARAPHDKRAVRVRCLECGRAMSNDVERCRCGCVYGRYA